MAELATRRGSKFHPGEVHPGAMTSLQRFRMTETDVADAVRTGELASPQQFENVWFFRVRLTGSGTSYRPKHKEEVYRAPEVFLTEEFARRFLGLPVVLEHPPKELLDSQEFAERTIGSVTQAWIEGEDIWGTARIYDQAAANFMAENQLSTSPAVVFRYAEETEKVPLAGGEHLLIEGNPSLLDHLAICREGVWDKGGPPSGVDISARSDSMADEDKREENKEASAETDRRDDTRRDDDARRDEKLDKLLTGIDSLTKRMDALEKRRDTRKRDDSKRDDGEEEAEQEREQAETLHELAEEEEQEAAREETEADRKDKKRDDRGRRDTHKRDDKKRDDDEDMPLHEAMARTNGEDDDAYSDRMDKMARRRDDMRRYGRRDDESEEEHADRCDAAHRRMARDDKKRDDRRDRRDARRDDDRRRDTYDDKRRDDEAEDGEESEREMAKTDARMDSIEQRLERIDRRTADRTDDEENSFADAQARADDAYGHHGLRAPRPMHGETLVGYRIRLLRGLQSHSPTWKDSDLGRIARADGNAFTNAEGMIYADAVRAGLNPTSVPTGKLREIRKRRPGGGEIIEFAGDPLSWMSSFMAPSAALERFGLRKS